MSCFIVIPLSFCFVNFLSFHRGTVPNLIEGYAESRVERQFVKRTTGSSGAAEKIRTSRDGSLIHQLVVRANHSLTVNPAGRGSGGALGKTPNALSANAGCQKVQYSVNEKV